MAPLGKVILMLMRSSVVRALGGLSIWDELDGRTFHSKLPLRAFPLEVFIFQLGGNTVTTGVLRAYQYSDLIFGDGCLKMRRLLFKFYSALELTVYCS